MFLVSFTLISAFAVYESGTVGHTHLSLHCSIGLPLPHIQVRYDQHRRCDHRCKHTEPVVFSWRGSSAWCLCLRHRRALRSSRWRGLSHRCVPDAGLTQRSFSPQFTCLPNSRSVPCVLCHRVRCRLQPSRLSLRLEKRCYRPAIAVCTRIGENV